MKVLITGAAGLVGRSLIAHPLAGAHDILGPSRVELDLTDARACEAYVRAERPDLVICAAGKVGGIAANMAEPAEFLAVNLAIGLNTLMACRRADVARIINLGSSCMYPAGIDAPLGEDRLLDGPPEPTNAPYAMAKLAVWKLACVLADEGVACRTLIPPNLYGPFERFDPLASHLLAAAMLKIHSAVVRGAPTVEIWGDGTARREFLFAGDLADFIWRHAERIGDLPVTLNVGVGEDHTVDHYFAAVAEVMGYEGGFTHAPGRPQGAHRKVLDISAQKRLGWTAPTPLRTGLQRMADWFAATHGAPSARRRQEVRP